MARRYRRGHTALRREPPSRVPSGTVHGILLALGVVLLTCLVIAVTIWVAILIAIRIAARTLHKANRVSPEVPSEAPLLWRWSFSQVARHHRRLQHIAQAARAARAAAGAGQPQVVDLAVEVERQACALDDQLALTARMPTNARLRNVFAMHSAILELEQVGVRLGMLAIERRPLPLEEPSLVDRVAALEHGRAEVARIEAETWGELQSIDALGRALANPASIPGVPAATATPGFRRA